jgi:hypothetical protein
VSLNVTILSQDYVLPNVAKTPYTGFIPNFGVVAYDNVVPNNDVFAEDNIFAYDYALTHLWLWHPLPLRLNPSKAWEI